MLVGIDDRIALFVLENDGRDLLFETTGFDGANGLFLTAQREDVLRFTRNLVLFDQVFGGDSHVVAIEDVGQSIQDGVIVDLSVAKPIPVSAL